MLQLRNMRFHWIALSLSVDPSEINFLFPVYTQRLLLFNVMTSDSISGPAARHLSSPAVGKNRDRKYYHALRWPRRNNNVIIYCFLWRKCSFSLCHSGVLSTSTLAQTVLSHTRFRRKSLKLKVTLVTLSMITMRTVALSWMRYRFSDGVRYV